MSEFYPTEYQIFQIPSFEVRTDATLKRIEEKLAALSGWQPISTAKAHCIVDADYLVGNAQDGVWVATWRIGQFYPEGDFFPVSGLWSSNEEPTHWQSLPTPPEK